MIPDVHYARTPEGVHIAYLVIGDGPIDIVFPGWGYSNIEYAWRIPGQRGFLRKIGSIGRLTYFDPRGMGLSDKIGGGQLPTLETQMGDVLSVMDAIGSEKAALLGFDASGPLAILFAATYPERTSALVVYGSEPANDSVPDYPGGWTEEQWDAYVEEHERRWGQPDYVREYLKTMAPSRTFDEQTLELYTAAFRLTGGPGTALALETMWRETDVRHVLPAVHVPTLVLHRTDDQTYLVAGARFLAEHVSGARFVELPGDDHLAWEGDSDAILSEINRFLRSVRNEEAELDRVLATVMFTDIVGSTERTSALGDRPWREHLADHDRIVRASLARYRGREIKTLGDGFLATFDGPARAVRCALAITARCAILVSTCASGFTPARSSSTAMTSEASRSTSVPVCRRWLSLPRFSSRARSKTSSPARVYRSKTAASTGSRAFPNDGASTLWRRGRRQGVGWRKSRNEPDSADSAITCHAPQHPQPCMSYDAARGCHGGDV